MNRPLHFSLPNSALFFLQNVSLYLSRLDLSKSVYNSDTADNIACILSQPAECNRNPLYNLLVLRLHLLHKAVSKQFTENLTRGHVKFFTNYEHLGIF